MQLQISTNRMQPIQHIPRHDTDQMKTPTQQKLEREANLSNPQVKQVAQEATSKVYETLQKMVQNTEYHISYSIDELGANKQVRFTNKTTGKVVVEVPPDVAVEIAERAKHQTMGLFLDFTA